MAAPIPVKSQCLFLCVKNSCHDMQQLIHVIGNTIQGVIQPYCQNAQGSQGKFSKLLPLRAFRQKLLPMHKNHYCDRIWGQFHQHFWCQSRAALAQSSFDAFDGNNIWQQCSKIWCSVQQLGPNICSKILLEMLVKQISICCAFYFTLVCLPIQRNC